MQPRIGALEHLQDCLAKATSSARPGPPKTDDAMLFLTRLADCLDSSIYPSQLENGDEYITLVANARSSLADETADNYRDLFYVLENDFHNASLNQQTSRRIADAFERLRDSSAPYDVLYASFSLAQMISSMPGKRLSGEAIVYFAEHCWVKCRGSLIRVAHAVETYAAELISSRVSQHVGGSVVTDGSTYLGGDLNATNSSVLTKQISVTNIHIWVGVAIGITIVSAAATGLVLFQQQQRLGILENAFNSFSKGK
jgi:hypothetical protein